MARYPGKKGVVYISTSGSTVATNVLALTKWSLDSQTEKLDVTAFNDGNKQYVQGFKDIKGDLSGFWDDTESKLFSGADSNDGVLMYLYPSADASSKYFYGPAYIDASMDVDAKGTVNVKANFVAKGTWYRSF